MKITSLRLTMACAALLAGAVDVRAQYSSDANNTPPPPGRPTRYYEPYYGGPAYVAGELGGSLIRNVNVKNNGGKLSFDPGTSFSLDFGYYLAPPISVELETGVIWNTVRHDAAQPLTTSGQDAYLYQVPILANVVLHAPLGAGCQLYLGAGAGGVVSEMYVASPSRRRHDNYAYDSDTSFAYQAMAGIKCPITRRMEVGVGYKFLGTLDHTWFDGDPLFTHTGPVYTHSIVATFTFNF